MPVMFDLETLDTKPTAVVLGIGAVVFNKHGVEDHFQVLLDVEEQLQAGRTVAWDTLTWWMAQEKAAQEWSFNKFNRLSVDKALFNFYKWTSGETEFWAKSPSFDAVIWENLSRDFRHLIPWGFRGLRDVRTLLSSVPEEIYKVLPGEPEEGVPHTPAYDAAVQARQVIEAQSYLQDVVKFHQEN